MSRVLIVGGGAAGLMAAWSAATVGAEVTVLERNQRPARKVMITGKGRCNVTNDTDLNGLISAVTGNGRFLYSAFSNFTSKDTMDFFENNGVPLKTERGNRVFPQSDKAIDIVDALVKAAKHSGVRILQERVTAVSTENGAVTGVRCESGNRIVADSVIVATGGLSYPLTGSTGDGYDIARALGHTVTELRPSLVPLNVAEGWCSDVQGSLIKLRKQLYFCQLFLKVRFSKRCRNAACLSQFRIPVETFTSPYITSYILYEVFCILKF